MSGRRFLALLVLATFLAWWLTPVRGMAQGQASHGVKSWTQPYGGCVEAHAYPRSVGARQCRAHGWTIRTRLVVGPHGWVRFTTMPHCTEEDGSSGPLPCTWNVGPGIDGNGYGLAYWIGPHHHTHYVRGTR